MQLTNHKWYALYLRSGFEKRGADVLAEKGYKTLLPTLSYPSRGRGKVNQKRVPMFPRYIFCRYDETISHRIVDSPGVIRIVGFGKKPVPVDTREMSSLCIVAEAATRVRLCKCMLAGQLVRIVDGPLRGVEGRFVCAKDESCVLVNITLLGRALIAELKGASVVPVAESILAVASGLSKSDYLRWSGAL